MASSTHAGALQSRKSDAKSSPGALARLATALGLAHAPDTAEPDILTALQTEHREVQALLEEILAATTAQKRSALFRKFKIALVKHARAEETVVYDRLIAMRRRDAQLSGHEGNVEHAVADGLIERATKIRDKMSPQWTATVKVLKEMLAHHIQEEEADIFSEVRTHFDPEERQKMGTEFEAQKKKVRA